MALTPTQEAQVLELINQQAALLSLANNEATITSKLAATKVNLGQLSPASSLADSDLMLVRQGVVEKSTTGSVLWNYIKTAIGVATDTVTGVARVATQAEVNSGTGTNTIVTPARMRLGFAISLAANGYIAFPTWMGGLIIQWGITSSVTISNTSATTSATLPIAFPSTFYRVVGVAEAAQSHIFANCNKGGLTNVNGVIQNINTTPYSGGIAYIAIGN
jgi:hypothetical protein